MQKVRELTGGRGVDIGVECVGVPEVLREGIEMLRKGGMYFEVGNYVETGEISVSPHRHFLAKSIRLIGMTNHPYTGYGPTLQLMSRYLDKVPFKSMVTHQYNIEKAEEGIKKSMQPESMKVVVTP